MTEFETIRTMSIKRLLTINLFANFIAPILTIIFFILTLADGLHVFKCGWFWTSLGGLFCFLSYFIGCKRQSLWRGSLGLLMLVIGFSAGITPFVAVFYLKI